MDEPGGWVKQTIPFSLLMIGAGLFIVGYGTYIARMAWTKNAEEYVEWLRQTRTNPGIRFWIFALPKSYTLWSDRILLIGVILFAVFMVLAGTYSLWRNTVGQ